MSGTGLDTPIARYLWESRYRDGAGGEERIEDGWRRVATALSRGERERAVWAERFFAILNRFQFLPGGRILAGAGSDRQVTLLNCFVMGPIGDDLPGIFESLKEGALTIQAGGGVGYDFSTLRPRGARAGRSGRIASGPVSFMHLWDAMCATMISTDARRGAMMGSLRCDHPDVGAFVDAKRRPGALEHFNLSLQVSDRFMEAVDRDETWPLLFPAAGLPMETGGETVRCRWGDRGKVVACRVVERVSARALWQRILRAAYDTAEPGVLFTDHINSANNLGYREWITTTNPCGEVPLPPYGACDLGSVNLPRFVRHPFTPRARLDLEAVAGTVAVAVRLLDNAIDLSWYPLAAQREQTAGARRIGIGITGLADTLIMLGLHYGEPAARAQARRVLEVVRDAAYRASIGLAREKGSFPFLERGPYLAGRFIRSLPAAIRESIGRHGIRNSHLLAIAPAGTISLLAGNVSSGIEPVFEFRVRRRVRDRDGTYLTFDLEDAAWRLWRRRHRGRLPTCFVTARELPPEAHLAMQAALQPLVDNAISKTINVPADYPFERFAQLYEEAHRLGLKGCTLFRPSPLRDGVLLPAAPQSGKGCCAPS